jgi:hypothetical protein
MGNVKTTINIVSAIELLNRTMDFSFVIHTNEKDYILMDDGHDCYSMTIGKKGGEQIIYINQNCTVMSIVRELIFNIGITKEITRNIRNSYIGINTPNIPMNMTYLFDINDEGFFSNITEFPYDYSSITHYGVYDYTKNGKPTLELWQNKAFVTETIGQRYQLSEQDIKKINHLAHLTNTNTNSSNTTKRGIEAVCSSSDILFFSGNGYPHDQTMDGYYIKTSDTSYTSEYYPMYTMKLIPNSHWILNYNELLVATSSTPDITVPGWNIFGRNVNNSIVTFRKCKIESRPALNKRNEAGDFIAGLFLMLVLCLVVVGFLYCLCYGVYSCSTA